MHVEGDGEDMSQADMMAVLKKDLAEAMREELNETVNRVVIKAFGRLTENLTKAEAKTVQNTRQLVEMRQEMAQQTAEVTTLRGAIEAFTTEVQTMRMEASTARTPRAPTSGLSTTWGPKQASLATKGYTLHTQRPDYSQERAVLLIWPPKIIPDHYKLMHSNILSECLTEAEEEVVSAAKAKLYVYRHKEDGESILVRASYPPPQSSRLQDGSSHRSSTL